MLLVYLLCDWDLCEMRLIEVTDERTDDVDDERKCTYYPFVCNKRPILLRSLFTSSVQWCMAISRWTRIADPVTLRSFTNKSCRLVVVNKLNGTCNREPSAWVKNEISHAGSYWVRCVKRDRQRLPTSWYTAPPPDPRRAMSICSLHARRSATSLNTFWFRPITRQG